ncbi:MAG: hypothetical protein ACRC6V_00520 [Bacteroidales bacterium]
MNKSNLASDLALEIICGCDRFDRDDIRKIVNFSNNSLKELRKETEK